MLDWTNREREKMGQSVRPENLVQLQDCVRLHSYSALYIRSLQILAQRLIFRRPKISGITLHICRYEQYSYVRQSIRTFNRSDCLSKGKSSANDREE